MVEFGLKLEDNKVAEWSDRYIDYERLKSLLKKAKVSAERLAAAEDECDDADLVRDARSSYGRRASLGRRMSGRSSEGGGGGGGGHLSRSSSKASLTLPATLSGVALHNMDHHEDENEHGAKAKAEGGEVDATSKKREGGDDDAGYGFFGGDASPERTARSEETVPLVVVRGADDDGQYGATDADADDDGGTERDEPLGDESSVPIKESSSFSSVKMAVSGAVTGYFQKGGGESSSGGGGGGANAAVAASRDKRRVKLEELMKATDDFILDFSTFLYNEIEKVNAFFKEKMTDTTNRLNFLSESADNLGLGHSGGGIGDTLRSSSDVMEAGLMRMSGRFLNQSTSRSGKKKSKGSAETKEDVQRKRELDSIRRAIREYYRTTKLLENYAIMNYTGFFKIIKKFNKNFKGNKGKFKEAFEEVVCCEGQEAEALGDRMEMLFAKWFTGGNVLDARVQILPKKGDTLEMDWTQFKLGFHLGLCAVLALWICWDCIWGLVRDGKTTIGARTAFPVFRACGGLLLIHWFWGFSVFMWSRYRVNYIFLFDFDPRHVRTPIMIFDDAVTETLVYLVLMLLYYKSGAHDLPEIFADSSGIFPFLLVLYTLKKLLLPWRLRGPLWRTIRDVVSTPLTPPMFFHSFVADWFTSMVKVFQDVLWALCFVFSGDFLLSEDSGESRHAWEQHFWYKNVVIPLVCLAPLWFRFNQSLRRYIDTGKRWPNLANAFKYALSMTVTLFGAFHPLYLYYQDQPSTKEHGFGVDLFQILWVGLFVTSSLYSYFWDVYMDWGLGRPQFKFLGPRLMYPQKAHYYGVVFVDLFLRFMWVMTLVPPSSGANFVLPSYLTAITMALELLRRTLWGLFRLENEHRHSTDQYRKVDFVPLHFSTGHAHKYEQKDSVGWSVLGEVTLVNLGVITVMVISVVAAQRAAHQHDVV